MAFKSSLVLVLYAIHAGAAKTTLSAELTNLLPICAHTCFTSFLDFNFALTKCGINPTLDCLCTTKSVSEYTVGEGAVQCVLSTAACTQGGAPDAAAFKAYTMCDGKRGSLPNTHATLTATLVVDSSTVSSARTTSTSNVSASTTITAIITDSSSSPSPSPSTLITTSQLPPPSTMSLATTSSSTRSEATSAAPISAASVPLLTKNQTIGVTVGSSIGALAILGLIIFVCLRRRKYQRSRDSDMLPFQLDPSNDLNYGHGFNNHMEKKITGPGGTPNGVATKFTPKIPMRIDTQSPNMFSRKSLKPDMIGVAISPETKQRRASRLLPEKPTLTLTVPEGGKSKVGLSYAAGGVGVSAMSRQSTATQFEEDFDSADTAVAADDSWGRGSNDLLYPPPQKKALATIPEPTQPVPAFLIPGRVQTAQTAIALPIASEFMVKPLKLSRGPMGSFSQPRKPDDYPSRAAQNQPQQSQAGVRQPLQVAVPPQPQTQSSPPRPERPTTSSSSIYSNTSLAASDVDAPPVLPRNARRSYRASGPYDKTGHQSNGSLTSFETVDSVVIPPTDFQVQPPMISQPSSSSVTTIATNSTSGSEGSLGRKPVLAPIITSSSLNASKSVRRQTATTLDLSPVVESPSSPRSGKSPVSYPKIPARGRLPEHTIRMVPPPAQPDFNSIFHSGRYAHQNLNKGLNYDGVSPEVISPIVASPTPIENSTAITPSTERNMKPWRVAELNAQRERERKERLGEPMSAIEPMSAMEIEIGMLTPAFPEYNPPSNEGNGNGNGNGGKLQPFLAGTGRIWPEQSSQGGYQQQQQRRPQQNGQERYLAPSAHFNPSIPPSQSQHQPQYSNQNQQTYHNQSQAQQTYKTPLQQQLQSSYQAYNPPSQQSRTQNMRSHTIPQTQGGRTLSPNLGNGSANGSHTRSSSVSSTASSLLAKRRGEQKGKALALNLSQSQKPNSNSKNGAGNGQEKWRVLNDNEKENAKSGAWRPKIGSVEREKDGKVWLGMRGEVGTGGYGDGGLGSGLGSGALPRTPGWVPKLTPTRRGDELFLSVA